MVYKNKDFQTKTQKRNKKQEFGMTKIQKNKRKIIFSVKKK